MNVQQRILNIYLKRFIDRFGEQDAVKVIIDGLKLQAQRKIYDKYDVGTVKNFVSFTYKV